ncbi:MAG: arsenite efflux transporter metallochaperone ArsD [Armatimonadetes bacterium]|nr:arsenite efflux transporter metallochaperone ArsD [Armatimonadota bacterium]
MKTLKIFDPAMCCSTGVCGPDVDIKLVRLAADVAFLKSQGIEVARFNLGQQTDAFLQEPKIIEEMGPAAQNLPIFLVEGEIKASGRYPDRAELASWFGLEAAVSGDKPKITLKMAGGCCGGNDEGCC